LCRFDGDGAPSSCTICLVLWAISGLVTIWVLSHALVTTSRDRRIVRSLNSLAAEGRNAEVLDHPLPSRLSRPAVRVLQAGSAVRTGRYAVALALLHGLGSRVRSTSPEGPSLIRAAALVGLGRYPEAAEVLGDRPVPGALRRLRAAVAVEVGDDALAEELLAGPHLDPLEESGRLRLLGDFRMRRGRLREAEELVNQSAAMNARLDVPGADVDGAYCQVLLGKVALRAGDVMRAVALSTQGLRAMQQRPDNAPGLAEAHAVAGQAVAASGDAAAAQQHLRAAHHHASRCGSPALDAELAHATAHVSLGLRQPAEAERWLQEALRRRLDLGERPAADEVRAALAALAALASPKTDRARQADRVLDG
jgi:tetratricopeptide (TPR) repeat protein